LEKLGFTCVGFQPFKHMARVREGGLFYLWTGSNHLGARLPISESLPQIQELASAILQALNIPDPVSVRDGAVGYPLQTELKSQDASIEDFETWRLKSQSANPPVEISGVFNLGLGYMRTASDSPLKALLAVREGNVTAGLAYYFDPYDRCVRFVNSFAIDDLSMGALFRHAVKLAQEQHSAVYVEVDILMTAPRLLKSAEQLGFVPIAYLPAVFSRDDKQADVVKMIKLNMVYSLENYTFTAQSRRIVEIIDHNFQDQKVGIAIINLLRGLPIFDGLGDGELRKMARLFTQKLFRPGEKIFAKGDSGNEAYVVMRGQIDILLDEHSKPLASFGNGQIFGELAFLDGAARTAQAVASQPSILLVIQRSSFNGLTQREPHLGMVVMRNIAMELSNRLRKTTAAVGKK
ncbi:MAG: cyclic nucleotide-binding domain-containing protein, partial [Verrucomicrobiota bacterium]